MFLKLNAAVWPVALVVWFLVSHTLAEHPPANVHRSLQQLDAFATKQIQADIPTEQVSKLLGNAAVTHNKAADISLAGSLLKVCIFSADFWGLKSAGGTATAYHLLAAVLAQQQGTKVTFLQATKRLRVCQEAKILNQKDGLDFECLSQHHFEPEVAETTPYESLSQAVLKWLMENLDRCDIVHSHEWGGVASSVVILNHLKQLKPGLRVAIEPHGGHVWSQLGEQNRPMDVGALRIDSNERIVNMLNDIEISPTNYMLSFLKQRGWNLPNSTLVIPNVVPDVEDHALAPVVKKKVWRIAFFGRLEERKGIKLFVEAVAELQKTCPAAQKNEFEIYIVGPEAVIDMVASKKWLTEKTKAWTAKTHLRISIKREEALNIISMEGMLLVLCSYIDNMPYVVAEAAVKAIPFLVFDAGGVLELFSHQDFNDVVVKDATAEALTAKLAEVLTAGSITTVKLASTVTGGQQKWIDYHSGFERMQEQEKIEDTALIERAASNTRALKVVRIASQQSTLELWEPVCLKGDATSKDILVILPENYEVINGAAVAAEISKVMNVAEMRHSPIAALSFGIQLASGKTAWPSSPTWMAYAGDHQHCMDDIPVAVAIDTFCNAFLGEARVFRYYNAWILALLLEHAGRTMVTYPKVFFKATELNSAGSANCAMDKIPKKYHNEYTTAASRLFKSADAMMHGMVLAQAQKPLVSLLEEAAVAQRHKGWEFGYLNGFANQTRELHHLVWEPAATNEFKENLWGCGPRADDTFVNFPHFKHQLLHPCHHDGAKCCNGTVHAPFILRLTSFFHGDQAALVLAYDAYPVCGDGFDFMVTHYPADLSRAPQVILDAGYDVVSKTSRPQRQKLEVPIDIRPGDQIDFVVDARHNYDCDGLYIVELKIWPPAVSE